MVEALKYEDDDGEHTYKSHKPLDADRKAVIATLFPDIAAHECFSVSTVNSKDFIVVKEDSDFKVLVDTCSITYEDASIANFVEYKFQEEDHYRLAKVTVAALESYRIIKFKQWVTMLHNPTCEAQFRRMLAIGVVTRLYDKQLFPTPDAFSDKYRVVDEHSGKKIDVPHMVEALRVWNSSAQQYEELPCHLEGAPTDEQRESWWKDKIFELQEEKGRDYIETLLKDAAGA